MPDTRLRQRAPLAVIRLARRVLANTPLQSLPIVSWLYRKTVRTMWGDGDLVVSFRGLRLTIPGGDHILAASVAGGYYESIELDILESLASMSDTVIDVGTNIGVHACVAANAMPPRGRVIAFEPVPANLRVLRANIAGNGLTDRILVEEAAVAEAPGRMDIHLSTSSNHSLVAEVANNSTETISVQVTSLDAYVAGLDAPASVDVLKVDVEGYDGYVLRGAAAVIKEHQPALLIEFVPSHLAKAGFPAEALSRLIFEMYPHVYVVDEPRRRLRPCTNEDLARYGDRSINLNLIAVSRPEHLEAVESYRGRIG